MSSMVYLTLLNPYMHDCGLQWGIKWADTTFHLLGMQQMGIEAG